MPGKIVKIDDCKELMWYVGDNKIKELTEFLDKIGINCYRPEEEE